VKTYYGKTLLMEAARSKFEIFKLLVESKYYDENMLLLQDGEMNAVSYAFKFNIDVTKYITEMGCWRKLMYYQNEYGDSLLTYSVNKPDIVEYICNSDKCNSDMLKLTNNIGENCGHIFISSIGNKYSFGNLVSSKLSDLELIQHRDLHGDTCLHIACKNRQDCISILLGCRFMTSDMWLLQNNKLHNPMMIMLENSSNMYDVKIFDKVLKFITNDLLRQTDAKKRTTLMYIARYNSNLLKKILADPLFDKDILRLRDCKLYTCIMYACKYNDMSVKLLLDVVQANMENGTDLLHSNHKSHGSCFTIAAKWSPQALQYLFKINEKLLLANILEFSEGSHDVMQVSCRYNGESMKYILKAYEEAKYEKIFKEYEKDNPIILAAKFQPSAIKYILDSKYASQGLFDIREDDKNCIDYAFDNQPQGLIYMIESRHSTPEILNREDHVGYRLLDKLKRVYPNIVSFDNLKEIKLTRYPSICGDTEDYDICKICYIFKTNITFDCGHNSCPSCAFKLKNCHICRHGIQHKNIIFD